MLKPFQVTQKIPSVVFKDLNGETFFSLPFENLEDENPSSPFASQNKFYYRYKIFKDGDDLIIKIQLGPCGEQCGCCKGTGKK